MRVWISQQLNRPCLLVEGALLCLSILFQIWISILTLLNLEWLFRVVLFVCVKIRQAESNVRDFHFVYLLLVGQTYRRGLHWLHHMVSFSKFHFLHYYLIIISVPNERFLAEPSALGRQLPSQSCFCTRRTPTYPSGPYCISHQPCSVCPNTSFFQLLYPFSSSRDLASSQAPSSD